MKKRVPPVFGKPRKEYDLDDRQTLLSLGINPEDTTYRKIPDRYVEYANGIRALVELKGGSHLKKGIKQLEEGVQRFRQANQPVNLTILFMERMNYPEARWHRIDKQNRLFDRTTRKQKDILGVELKIYLEEQVDRMYGGLDAWVST